MAILDGADAAAAAQMAGDGRVLFFLGVQHIGDVPVGGAVVPQPLHAVLFIPFIRHAENAPLHLDGAVESSVQLGVADLIADVVSTGTTLRNAGLRIFADPIVHSEAVLIRSPRLDAQDERLIRLSRRLQGVLTAKRYVLMDFDIPVEKVSAAVSVTPGFESPTISPLHDKQWSAVRVMVPKAQVNQVMDQLYEVGARGIIVTAIQASRM